MTDIASFPFMAQLILNDTFHCGGVIVGERKVITAVHCFPIDKYLKATTVKVRVGSFVLNDGGVLINVSKYKLHPQFDKPYNNDNDIAVLILEQPLNLSTSYIKTISMAEPGESDYIYENMSSEFMIVGYGATDRSSYPTNLRWLQEPIFNSTECEKIYQNIYAVDVDKDGKKIEVPYHITKNMFCSGKRPLQFIGFGDSGGKSSKLEIYFQKLI